MAMVSWSVGLRSGSGKDLWNALQADERWSRPDAVSVAVDPDNPSRGVVRARCEDIDAVKRFRDEIGTELVVGVKSGFSVELLGEPAIYVNPDRLERS